jgi:fructose-1,6-bisphosphatase
MIRIAQEAINGPILTEETGIINVKGDHQIGMDVRIEELLIEYIKENNLPVNIFSEEQGVINFHQNPKFLVAFDPLDGSTNSKLGKNILPYGLLIAFYNNLQWLLKRLA